MDDWTEGHELAALERLFEIALERLLARGYVDLDVARSLVMGCTKTQNDFAGTLQYYAHMTHERIRIEIAHVHRVVAERAQREP